MYSLSTCCLFKFNITERAAGKGFVPHSQIMQVSSLTGDLVESMFLLSWKELKRPSSKGIEGVYL